MSVLGSIVVRDMGVSWTQHDGGENEDGEEGSEISGGGKRVEIA